MVGIKIKSYSNSFFNEDLEWNHIDDFGQTNTDRSSYRPTESVARVLSGNYNKQLIYDFPDGKDTGQVVQTVLRSPGLDVTEVDSMTKRVTTIVENKRDLAKKKVAEVQEKEQILDRLAPKSDTSEQSSPVSS